MLKGSYRFLIDGHVVPVSWCELKDDKWIQFGADLDPQSAEKFAASMTKRQLFANSKLAAEEDLDEKRSCLPILQTQTQDTKLFEEEISLRIGSTISMIYNAPRDSVANDCLATCPVENETFEFRYYATNGAKSWDSLSGEIDPAIYYDTKIMRSMFYSAGLDPDDDDDDEEEPKVSDEIREDDENDVVINTKQINEQGSICKAMCIIPAQSVLGDTKPLLMMLKSRIQTTEKPDSVGRRVYLWPERVSIYVPVDWMGAIFGDAEEHQRALEWSKMHSVSQYVLAQHQKLAQEQQIPLSMPPPPPPPPPPQNELIEASVRGAFRAVRKAPGRAIRRVRKAPAKVKKVAKAVKGKVGKAASAVKSRVSKTASAVKSRASSAKKAVTSRVKTVRGAVSSRASAAKKAVSTRASAVRKAVQSRIPQRLGGTKGKIPTSSKPGAISKPGPLKAATKSSPASAPAPAANSAAAASSKPLPKPPVSKAPAKPQRPSGPLPSTPAKQTPARFGEGQKKPVPNPASSGGAKPTTSTAKPSSSSNATDKPYWLRGDSSGGKTQPTPPPKKPLPPVPSKPKPTATATPGGNKKPSDTTIKKTSQTTDKKPTKKPTEKPQKKPAKTEKPQKPSKSSSSGNNSSSGGGPSSKASDSAAAGPGPSSSSSSNDGSSGAGGGAPIGGAGSGAGAAPLGGIGGAGIDPYSAGMGLGAGGMGMGLGTPGAAGMGTGSLQKPLTENERLALLGQQRLAEATQKSLQDKAQAPASAVEPPTKDEPPKQQSQAPVTSTVVNINLTAPSSNSEAKKGTTQKQDQDEVREEAFIGDEFDRWAASSSDEEDGNEDEDDDDDEFYYRAPPSSLKTVLTNRYDSGHDEDSYFNPGYYVKLAKNACNEKGLASSMSSEYEAMLLENIKSRCASGDEALGVVIDALIDDFHLHVHF